MSSITLSPKSAEISKKMQENISQLIKTTSDTGFANQAPQFLHLFNRYLKQTDDKKVVDWSKIQIPSAQELIYYDKMEVQLADSDIKNLLSSLVVLKLNGGLGTTMGCTGPKSVIEVRPGITFLDLTVQHIVKLNKKYGVDIPLVLMNSFNTHEDTHKIVSKYQGQLKVFTFNQKQYPRIIKDSNGLMPKTADPNTTDKEEWFPPGHGDVFDSLYNSPLYAQLRDAGKKYIFLSNIDNLGATVDANILHYLQQNNIDFCMEVTPKTRADVKGGTLIKYEGNMKLLEIASVPKDKVEEFKSIRKFKIFNTNNLWIRFDAIAQQIQQLNTNIDIIVNQKTVQGGLNIIQLETAAGAAIEVFQKSIGIVVHRTRFLPVKACSDLLLIQSNLYSIDADLGTLVMNPMRIDRMGEGSSLPSIKTSAEFNKVNDYMKRLGGSVPDILELESLTIQGNVFVGKGVSFKGNVIIIAQDGARIDIPDGSILENKCITGSLKMADL